MSIRSVGLGAAVCCASRFLTCLQSEYTATSDQRRQWLTGFTGSAGTAIVGRDGRALLFVDSR